MLVIGDSLSSGYGIDPQKGWVALLERKVKQRYPDMTVINDSISGDTTLAAKTRFQKSIEKHKPSILILELGGNDGLRGLPLAKMKKNLNTMIEYAKSKDIKILLIGIRIPPNYGQQYTKQFEQIYPDLAKQHNLPLVPRLLENVGGNTDLMQPDGVHPRENAQEILLNNVWPQLKKLLE